MWPQRLINATLKCDPYMMDGMTTYSIREAKARLSEIVRDLERGGEVTITRRGRPCGRLAAVDAGAADKPSLAILRGALAELPDAGYPGFRDIKGIWETGESDG